jgi:hypothetical protein
VDQLVDSRMEKKRRMRWTRRGAQMLLQARCALINRDWANTPGGRPQNHRRCWRQRHEPPSSFQSHLTLDHPSGGSINSSRGQRSADGPSGEAKKTGATCPKTGRSGLPAVSDFYKKHSLIAGNQQDWLDEISLEIMYH